MKNSFLLIVLLFSSFMIAQTKSTTSDKTKSKPKSTTHTKAKSNTKTTSGTMVVSNSGIVPPEKVAMTFQKEYPNKIAVWSQEYVGDDNDEIRYEAKFNTDKKEKALAVYDNLGTLKAFQLEIPINKLPSPALTYLKKNYESKAIHVASVVVDDKNQKTYEVGVEKDTIFYDVVFDKDGKFNVITQKN